jgi:hypothetical protein
MAAAQPSRRRIDHYCIVSHMHSLFLNDKVHTFILIAAGNTASYCMTTPTLNMGE